MSHRSRKKKRLHAAECAREERDRAGREEHNRRQGILRLPPELRYQIYDLVAPNKVAGLIYQLKQNIIYNHCRTSFPALLSACRQLRTEYFPIYLDKVIPSLELRELLEPWMRHRRIGNHRTAFVNAFGKEILACVRRFEVRCQWRCLTCGFSAPRRGLPGDRYLVVNDEDGYMRWSSWSTSYWGWHTVDSIALEIDRKIGGKGIKIRTLAEVRGEGLRECCRASANKVAEKILRELQRMGVQNGEHTLNRVEFEMLARRMRWCAWRKRWVYRLSKHVFILAWYDIKTATKTSLRKTQLLRE